MFHIEYIYFIVQTIDDLLDCGICISETALNHASILALYQISLWRQRYQATSPLIEIKYSGIRDDYFQYEKNILG